MRGIHISMSLSANVSSAGQGILHNGLPLERITRNKQALVVLSLITRKKALFCLTMKFLHLPKYAGHAKSHELHLNFVKDAPKRSKRCATLCMMDIFIL